MRRLLSQFLARPDAVLECAVSFTLLAGLFVFVAHMIRSLA